MRVFCRIRPVLKEKTNIRVFNINIKNEYTMSISQTGHPCVSNFTFDKIFERGVTQVTVFMEVEQLIQSVLDGSTYAYLPMAKVVLVKRIRWKGDLAATLWASFRVPLSIYIFHSFPEQEKMSWTFTMEVSFLEIYKGTINDLLDPKKVNLKIRGTYGTDGRIDNKSKEDSYCCCNNEKQEILQKPCHEAFDASSSYQRQQESKHINKSLFCLRNVIQAINGKKTYVPYRTSKLTKLLEPYLAGDAKMLMIVNIAPFQDCYKESLRSLEFASVVNKCDGSANYQAGIGIDMRQYGR
ncbi:non-claret disjunctional [Carabus blaptoides fortunei]